MKNLRSYYSDSVQDFLIASPANILGLIHRNDISAETRIHQSSAWESEIDILKTQLKNLSEGRIIFEYTIPRMGKRVDVVILHSGIVFLLEFKCGSREYPVFACDQVYDYALDLRNFQKESHDKLIIPVVVATSATHLPVKLEFHDRIANPILCNAENIYSALTEVVSCSHEAAFNYEAWENSEYMPTPTIVEAAQALYRGHNVHDITRSDAGAENLTATADEINTIIEYSRLNNRKSICFVTGVPGAGKTLVGLNMAVHRSNAQQGEHAVFLSGNYPLVTVLQEALARDKIAQERLSNHKISKNEALLKTSAFIQIIHRYRDSFINNNNIPPERVAIFDEAQRAWTKDKIRQFMKEKKGVPDFKYSEPEFLISTMDRHTDWAVIICLIGGGQEINTGEAGLPEWFDSLRRSFQHWDVYITPKLHDDEYQRGVELSDRLHDLNVIERPKLHLAVSVRSFRTPDLATFVKAVLDSDISEAKRLYSLISDKYPIVITRDISTAKKWIRDKCRRGTTTRCGLLASSGALRLKPEGIFVKNNISVSNWFLNGKDDVRSSYALEDAATEFDVQGLELDYALVAWDADFRRCNEKWTYMTFRGNSWNSINAADRRLYLKNAYRVLLTRARQGMAIFVPNGDDDDPTRKCEYYDGIYHYLRDIGLEELFD